MKQLTKNLLDWLGYRVESLRYTPQHLLRTECVRQLEFDDVVCRYMFDHGQTCTFIQVGAYDGITADPLRRYIERCGWRGVMLEPQPGAAAKLRHLYGDNSNIIILQGAVDKEYALRTLYTVASDSLPPWAAGMASFDREHIVRHDHLLPGIGRYIRELRVDCIPFEEVLKSLPRDGQLDLLQIDAEGADGRILSWFPFEHIKPPIVHWEAKNLTKNEQEVTLDLMCSHGYRIARSGSEDMLAVRC